MGEFIKNNKVTMIVVLATIILAAVAIFTAVRLYQLRDESVSLIAPESAPSAAICSEYTFRVSQDGEVFARNASGKDEPEQNAKVYIDSVEAATLQIPALGAGTAEASVGTVIVPSSAFVWEVIGSKDCSDNGSYDSQTCSLKFTLSSANTTTNEKGGIALAPSPSISPTPTATPTASPVSTNPPSLPDAGVGLPTIIGMGVGALLLFGAVLLAF